MKNQTRYLVVSVDYEIFGNGTGDVRQHMIRPAEQMAAICEKYAVPLTVFLEVEEFLAFEKYSETLEVDLGYNPAEEIRKQVVSFIEKGHDIQLHIHPEWYGATYVDGEWCLHRDRQAVDDLFESVDETVDYIRSRKLVIEKFYEEAGSSRKVSAYRAGAFCAQPGEKLLAGLAACGICIDSSVVCGLHGTKAARPLDFRNAPRGRRLWRVSSDVVKEDPRGLIREIPVYSRLQPRFRQITLTRLKAKFSRKVPGARQKEVIHHISRGKGPFQLLRYFFETFPTKLDYHNLSPRTFVNWVLNAGAPGDGEPDILVSIGHTKEHRDDLLFEEMIKLASGSDSIQGIGFGEVADILSDENCDEMSKNETKGVSV